MLRSGYSWNERIAHQPWTEQAEACIALLQCGTAPRVSVNSRLYIFAVKLIAAPDVVTFQLRVFFVTCLFARGLHAAV
jgi:hypothetical protein